MCIYQIQFRTHPHWLVFPLSLCYYVSMIDLPQEYTERMKALLGASFDAYLRSFDAPPERGLLINTQKITEQAFDALFPYPTEPIPYLSFGRRLLSQEKVGGDPLHAAGLYYMQDPGAMSAVAALPEVQGRILDLAAAPGGKTIGAALRFPDAFIVANEVNFSRAKILMQNVERLGLKNVGVTSLAPKDFAKYTPESFDLIIADLPCSGEGMFRKEPAAVMAWNAGINRMNAERQKEILSDALPALKKGGVLLYSTCTYAPEENEEILSYLLQKGFSLLSPRKEVLPCTAPALSSDGRDLSNARRFYPFISPGEGQFFALLQKEGEALYTLKSIPAKVTVNELKRLRAFTDKALVEPLSVVNKQGDSYYAVHPLARTLPLRYLSEGVRLGEFSGEKFLPHHNLFTAFGAEFSNKENLTLDDPRLSDYLMGLEIDAKSCADGAVAVLLEGYPLGGGKCVGGRIKNHYPKGLRNKAPLSDPFKG